MKYIIKYYVEVYEYDYNEGELRHVNSFVLKHYSNLENVKEAIIEGLQPLLINDSIEIHSDEQVGIYTNILVDDNIDEATSTEVEKWKEGKLNYIMLIFL